MFTHLMDHPKHEIVKAYLELLVQRKLNVQRHHAMPTGAMKATAVQTKEANGNGEASSKKTNRPNPREVA
jgi:hypothetical protein